MVLTSFWLRWVPLSDCGARGTVPTPLFHTLLATLAQGLVLSGILAWAPSACAGVTFVVDPVNPGSSDAGPGDASRPYRTISAAVTAHAGPDITILVRPGTYREHVNVTGSGRPGRPFVIRAEDGPVVIDGAADFSAPGLWTPYSGDVWVAASVTWRPTQVFAGDARLLSVTVPPEGLATGQFRWVSGAGLFVNAGGTNPSSMGLSVGARSHGFLVADRAHVRIEGFEITRSEAKGVEVIAGSHDVAIENNVVTYSGSGGISLESCYGVLVRGNKVSASNHHGILLRLGVTGAMIVGNESFANAHEGQAWANGIYLSESSGNLLLRNNVHHNQDTGFEIQTGSNDNRLLQNRSWSNGDHGFEHLFASGTLSIGNVAWGNVHDGFSVEGNSTGTKLYNCIAAENGLASAGYNLFVDSSSVAGFDADWNVSWKSDGTPPVKYDRNTYATIAAFIGATGMSPHTSSGDPLFVKPMDGDFHLLAGSPAIDAANSGVLHFPESDLDGLGPSDDPTTANTGVGPIEFADRGAYEYAGATLSVDGSAPASAFRAFHVAPNPVYRSAAFSLDLATASDVRCSVFDVSGREVWSDARTYAAGRSELRWGLRDRSGASIPMGVYLARITVGDRSQALRFAVVR